MRHNSLKLWTVNATQVITVAPFNAFFVCVRVFVCVCVCVVVYVCVCMLEEGRGGLGSLQKPVFWPVSLSGANRI